MFYEEKVINGVLCYRASREGEWKPLTIEALTSRLVVAEARVKGLEARGLPTRLIPMPFPVGPFTIPTVVPTPVYPGTWPGPDPDVYPWKPPYTITAEGQTSTTHRSIK